jgi:hypothetical protein
LAGHESRWTKGDGLGATRGGRRKRHGYQSHSNYPHIGKNPLLPILNNNGAEQLPLLHFLNRYIHWHQAESFVPILYQAAVFDAFDDFSDFAKSTSANSKTCQ